VGDSREGDVGDSREGDGTLMGGGEMMNMIEGAMIDDYIRAIW
jgi:hypothetical protein